MTEVSCVSAVWIGELGWDDDTSILAIYVPVWSLAPSASAGTNWIGSIMGGCKGWSTGRFLQTSILLCCISINLSSTEGYIGANVSLIAFLWVLDDDDGDKALLSLVYTLFRGISSVSDEVDKDEEREAGLDLILEDVLDSIVTISPVVWELEIPSGAYEATGASEHPASSCATLVAFTISSATAICCRFLVSSNPSWAASTVDSLAKTLVGISISLASCRAFFTTTSSSSSSSEAIFNFLTTGFVFLIGMEGWAGWGGEGTTSFPLLVLLFRTLTGSRSWTSSWMLDRPEPVASATLSFLAFLAFFAGCSEASSRYSSFVRDLSSERTSYNERWEC